MNNNSLRDLPEKCPACDSSNGFVADINFSRPGVATFNQVGDLLKVEFVGSDGLTTLAGTKAVKCINCGEVVGSGALIRGEK